MLNLGDGYGPEAKWRTVQGKQSHAPPVAWSETWLLGTEHRIGGEHIAKFHFRRNLPWRASAIKQGAFKRDSPIQQHGISFHLFVWSSIFFINVIVYGAQGLVFWHSFFFLRCFILSNVMVNEIASLISDVLLSVYRDAIDFWILILYSATFLKLLMSSRGFMMASLGFSVYAITSSANSDSFTSFFLIWISFISFSSLIAVSWTSKTMSKKSGESGHPRSVHNPTRNAFRFSPLSMPNPQ